MSHYGLEMEKIQPRSPHENGDVESSHGKFREAVDQALMMRGRRDFSDIGAYREFLQQVVEQRNRGRSQRLADETPQLRALPARPMEGYTRYRVTVNTGSLIRVKGNTYSVHSRLIGETVEARLHMDHVEIWYAQRKVDQFPRLRGRGNHRINYRHVIDWLVRKPGAFANYRYRDDLFPNVTFRQAYDALSCQRSPKAATKDYLAILHLAAYESETRVAECLRVFLDEERRIVFDEIKVWVVSDATAPPVTDVTIDAVDLSSFDCLFEDSVLTFDMEVTG
jgi:hypothetical protein